MIFQKFKTGSFCSGGRHRTATKNISGDITSKSNKIIIGHSSIYNRKKSLKVSDNTIAAEVVGDFFRNLGKKGLKVSKK